jgi:hypothetical protein
MDYSQDIQALNALYPSKVLQVLNLYDTPVMETMKDDPKEREAVLSLLKTRSSIYNLGGRKKDDYPADVECALRFNHAGGNVAFDDKSIPLSLWPTILKRAYEKSNIRIYDKRYYEEEKEKNPTGLYFLLREGPVLFGRAELGDKDPSPHNNLGYHNNSLDSFFQSNFAHLQSLKEKKEENLLKRKHP